jgi:hypothetical protein
MREEFRIVSTTALETRSTPVQPAESRYSLALQTEVGPRGMAGHDRDATALIREAAGRDLYGDGTSVGQVRPVLAVIICLLGERREGAIPRSLCRIGTIAFKYIRSIPSTSSVTWSRRISATVRGTVISGSGRPWLLRGPPNRYAVQMGESPIVGSAGALFTSLVGLRRSLVSTTV